MIYSPDQRRQIMLSVEGGFLERVGQLGEAVAAESARCTIDGIANALMRIEGPERAAEFTLALGDRMVGNIRTPTEMPLANPAPEKAAEKPAAPEERPIEQAPRKSRVWAYFWGFVHGAALAAYVLAVWKSAAS